MKQKRFKTENFRTLLLSSPVCTSKSVCDEVSICTEDFQEKIRRIFFLVEVEGHSFSVKDDFKKSH